MKDMREGRLIILALLMTTVAAEDPMNVSLMSGIDYGAIIEANQPKDDLQVNLMPGIDYGAIIDAQDKNAGGWGDESYPSAQVSKQAMELWIETRDRSHQQYAAMNQHKSLSLMAYTSMGGQGEIIQMYPSTSSQGTYEKTGYNFNPGINPITFNGEVPGIYILLFTINNICSNAITIDVKGTPLSATPIQLPGPTQSI